MRAETFTYFLQKIAILRYKNLKELKYEIVY